MSVSSTPRSCLSTTPTSPERYKSVLSPVRENLESSPRRSVSDQSHAARKLYFSPSSSSNRAELFSPSSRSSCRGSSSNRESSDDGGLALFSSPTTGLPNYVIDGTAPHLLANSPQKKTKENVNLRLVEIKKRRRSESSRDDKSPSEKKSKRTPSRRLGRLNFAKEKTKRKDSVLMVPAITNFYSNLSPQSTDAKSSQ